MFEATLANADTFKQIVASIIHIVQTANMDIDSSGIAIQSMDSCHVALIDIFLNSMKFTKFECTKPYVLGIDFSTLHKVLKCSKAKDQLTLRYDGDDSNVLHLRLMDEGE